MLFFLLIIISKYIKVKIPSLSDIVYNYHKLDMVCYDDMTSKLSLEITQQAVDKTTSSFLYTI